MVDWRQATEQDLLDLISNNERESHYLDFKRRESSLTPNTEKRRVELGKDVSAFAHADGGTLIYGMAEDDHTGTADRLEGFAQSEMSKERLTQMIQTSTSPPVVGVFVRPVELQQSDPGNWAFVVTVPQAEAVHQAQDKKFHRRDNADTRVMYRDEIIDILTRAQGPRLRLAIVLRNGGSEEAINWASAVKHAHNIHLPVNAENRGKLALYALFRLFIEQSTQMQVIQTHDASFVHAGGALPPGLQAQSIGYAALQRKWSVPPNVPIFTDEEVGIGSLSLQVQKTANDWDGSISIYWQCIAPEMLTSVGGVSLNKTGDKIILNDLTEDQAASLLQL